MSIVYPAILVVEAVIVCEAEAKVSGMGVNLTESVGIVIEMLSSAKTALFAKTRLVMTRDNNNNMFFMLLNGASSTRSYIIL